MTFAKLFGPADSQVLAHRDLLPDGTPIISIRWDMGHVVVRFMKTEKGFKDCISAMDRLDEGTLRPLMTLDAAIKSNDPFAGAS